MTKKSTEDNIEEKALPYQDIIKWANLTNTEAIQDDFYHWTDEAKKVRRLLENGPRGNLIAVVGLQGSGKTRLMRELSVCLSGKIFSEKWLGRSYLLKFAGRWREGSRGYSPPSDLPSPAERQLEREQNPAYFFSQKDIILIDLPDYSKRTVSQRDRHLDEISYFRDLLCNITNQRLEEFRRRTERSLKRAVKSEELLKMQYCPKPMIPTIVLFIQKELYTDHFFLNKFKRFELRPINPQTLVDIFQYKFSKYPFTDEALFHLASLSRGIFRRFQNYIAICMNCWLDNYEKAGEDIQITLDHIKEWIPTKQLLTDMDLELSRIFNKEANRATAVTILKYLQEHGETGQSVLVEEFFDGNKMHCSRILKALKSKYLNCRSEGKHNYWSLRPW